MNPLEDIIKNGNRPPSKPYETYRERRKSCVPNWIRLGDGTVISVIAGPGTYCEPRPALDEDISFPGEVSVNYPGPYSAVEVWFPENDDPEMTEVSYLLAYAEEHGGVKSAHVSEAEARESE